MSKAFWFSGCLMAAATLAIHPADAQSSRGRDWRSSNFSAARAYVSEPESGSPILALISIGSQRLDIYDRSGLIGSSPISSGRRGHDSPQGVFSVIEKKVEHYSNLYDDASMPHMQRLTWSGVAMHAGVLPGYPASHGCIRLPAGFARAWYGVTKLNTRVVITQDSTSPEAISHRTLFQPRLMAAAATTHGEPQEAEPRSQPHTPSSRPPAAFTGEDSIAEMPMMLGARVQRPEAFSNRAAHRHAVAAKDGLLSPREAARTTKAAADRGLALAVKSAEAARATLKKKQADFVKAERAAKTAEVRYDQAVPKLAAANRTAARARTDKQYVDADEARARVVTMLAAMAAAATEKRGIVDALAAELNAARATAEDAEKEKTSAQAVARDAARLAEPVSVFVSRETGRVYVRQNREPVMEMAVTLADPSRPIGTHVFTAMSSNDGGRTVEWNVVTAESVADGPTLADADRNYRRDGRVMLARSDAAPASADSEAAAALDRIEFPQEVIDRVAPWLVPGSSLIVSDLGPSFETGRATDFIVQTRGEQEARASVRRIANQKRAERSRRNWDDDDGYRRSYASRRARSSWWD